MAKERASIRGKGEEIFFGEPPAVEVEPRAADPANLESEEPMSDEHRDASGSSTGPDEDADLAFDVEMERALEEEALAAGPEPGGEDGGIGPSELELSPELGVDLSYSLDGIPIVEPGGPETEEFIATAEELSGLDAEIPLLATDDTLEALDEESVLFEPPPAEIDDVAYGVLPPKPEAMFVDMGEEEGVPVSFGLEEEAASVYDIQEPEDQVEAIELPDRELTEEERAQILAWLGEERLAALETAIDEAYREIRLTVANNRDITTDCQNQLLKARDIIVRRDAANLAQAEYYVESVRARLERASASDTAARKYQWWILIWGLFWSGALLALLIMLNESWFRDLLGPVGLENRLVDMDVFLSTMIWGGIGGGVAVLYSLFKHVGRRDFDRHFSLSYIGKPLLGLIVGATVYMVFNLVVRTLGILPVQLEGVEKVAAPAVAPGVMYLLAWFGGFKENRIFDLMDRTMRGVFSSGEAS